MIVAAAHNAPIRRALIPDDGKDLDLTRCKRERRHDLGKGHAIRKPPHHRPVRQPSDPEIDELSTRSGERLGGVGKISYVKDQPNGFGRDERRGRLVRRVLDGQRGLKDRLAVVIPAGDQEQARAARDGLHPGSEAARDESGSHALIVSEIMATPQFQAGHEGKKINPSPFSFPFSFFLRCTSIGSGCTAPA